jgi:colicin import membrane protein
VLRLKSGIKNQKSKIKNLAICLSIVPMLINGCAGKSPPNVDIKMAGDSIVDARESIALARSEGSSEHAPEEFARAGSLLKEAQEAVRKAKNRVAADLAFQADVEAKIAIALAREAKAERRAQEARESKLTVMWEAKTDEVAAAKARRAIAEKMAIEARKEAERAKARADKAIQRAEIELIIAKAELEMNLADQRRASEYAKGTYTKAKSSLQAAKSALAADDLQKAMTAAEEAARHTSNASIQAEAKLEADAEESLRRRDRAVAAITKAEVSLEGAEEPGWL